MFQRHRKGLACFVDSFRYKARSNRDTVPWKCILALPIFLFFCTGTNYLTNISLERFTKLFVRLWNSNIPQVELLSPNGENSEHQSTKNPKGKYLTPKRRFRVV